MLEVVIDGRHIRLDRSQMRGEGGEAEVYELASEFPGKAVKLWKPPTHPDFKGSDELHKRNREGAKLRLAEQQQKLPAFPKGLPDRVVVPERPAMDKSGKVIIGYTMSFLKDAEVLRSYSLPAFRQQQGISNEQVTELFRDLYRTVVDLHAKGVVIGDFKNLNALVKGSVVYLIDADSMQFGAFPCRTFSPRFVDPLICDKAAAALVQVAPHTTDTDWYAFSVMAFETLLLVHPFGGVYKPARLSMDQRVLRRLSVFHADVQNPAAAMPFDTLPDELMHFFHEVMEKNKRGDFPAPLLDDLRWTTCASCGFVHARGTCPKCSAAAPKAALQMLVKGNVRMERVFATAGELVTAAVQNGTLRYLYHEGGVFKRETHKALLTGPMNPALTFRLAGEATAIESKGNLVILDAKGGASPRFAVDHWRGKDPVFDTNGHHVYWAHGGSLLREHMLGSLPVGQVLNNQTWFRVGPAFGFGFYRAGGVQVAFVFDAEHQGIKDSVNLPPLRGGIVDLRCSFSDERCWFFVTLSEAGRLRNHCFLIDRHGAVIDSKTGDEGDGSWLGSTGAKCSATLRGAQGHVHCLFSMSDNGLVRLQEESGRIKEGAVFPDLQGIIDPSDQLFFGRDGIYVATRREIFRVTLQ